MIVSFLIDALMVSVVPSWAFAQTIKPDDQDRRRWLRHHDRFRALTYGNYPADELTATFVADRGASVVALPKHIVDEPTKPGAHFARRHQPQQRPSVQPGAVHLDIAERHQPVERRIAGFRPLPE
jgi:hypothetical protein